MIAKDVKPGHEVVLDGEEVPWEVLSRAPGVAGLFWLHRPWDGVEGSWETTSAHASALTLVRDPYLEARK